MPVATSYPIDIHLWRRAKTAPQSEGWKWDWERWEETVIRPTFNGEIAVDDVVCPICGKKKLYIFFLAFHLARQASSTRKRPVYVGDRWWGCEACQTQIRDYGEVPSWIKDEDVMWVTEEAQAKAKKDFTKIENNLNMQETT